MFFTEWRVINNKTKIFHYFQIIGILFVARSNYFLFKVLIQKNISLRGDIVVVDSGDMLIIFRRKEVVWSDWLLSINTFISCCYLHTASFQSIS